MTLKYNQKLTGLCTVLMLCLIVRGAQLVKAQNDELITQGSRTGLASAMLIARQSVFSVNILPRPSANLGLFVSSYLAQGAFVEARSALVGVASQRALIKGQQVPNVSESFAILTDLGVLLQIDVADLLNRNPDRRLALDQYLTSLKSVGSIAERKREELATKELQLKAEEKEVKKEVRDLERNANTALRNEDYRQAAEIQERLVSIEAKLATLTTELKQLDDMIGRFEDLLEIAVERTIAIESNREVLIAGLQVRDVPGIEDFNILQEGKSYRRTRSRRSGNDNKDIFGREHIDPETQGQIFKF